MGYFVAIVVLLTLWLFIKNNIQKKHFHKGDMEQEWIDFLIKHVPFYKNLNDLDKYKFGLRLINFLNNTRVVGFNNAWVSIEDKLLVGASAIIPVFNFPKWRYSFINEVIIRDDYLKREGSNGFIGGFVGSGPMEGRMVLVRKALYGGFSNSTDKINTGVHEFIHIIDKQDGLIDGIPKVMINHIDIGPWLELIRIKSKEISEGKAKINNYALTNQAEFFAVVSEYFFEMPELMEKKHPKLYEVLKKLFS
jgi:Mlc titration factor MtfA (ptsG expression regulator)